MIEVHEWTKQHRSALAAWPIEPSLFLPAFLLRSSSEPYEYTAQSYAVMLDVVLVGRFTFRSVLNTAFVGLVINPAYRGLRLSVPAMRACLVRLGTLGLASAYCSVALANVPSYKMLIASGFSPQVVDWRLLPDSFDTGLLVGFPTFAYRLGPFPAMAYVSMSVALDALMYTEVA